MEDKNRNTYEADHKGRKVRVTVPENDEQDLFDAIREQLSPEAVASIAAHLAGASTNNQTSTVRSAGSPASWSSCSAAMTVTPG